MNERPSRPEDRIAELEAENATLRRRNGILAETLDAIDGTVVVYDADRRYVLGNRAYHRFFEKLPDESALIGLRFEDILTLSVAAGGTRDEAAYTDPAAFFARRVHEFTDHTPQQREVYDPLTDTWQLLRSQYTQSGSRVTLRVDITEQKRLQRDLERARLVAEAASRLKSQFLASISHELRTPLNAVLNFARLIAEQAEGPIGSPRYVAYARDIRESGQNLLALIDELLDLARAEAGYLTIKDGVLRLGPVVRGAARLLRPEADAAGIQLAVDMPDALPAVRGDAGRLRQILLNLLSNAIKFTPRNGAVQLRVALEPAGDIRVTVSDTGIGISERDRERVMQPFERGSQTATQPGAGLGLPLARHLAELHGGSLELSANPGGGTVAKFVLPADRVLTDR